MSREENIMRNLYENFKLQWMLDHGYTMKDVFELVEEWHQECGGGAEDYVSFEHYLEEVGFDGMLWPCYSEWLDYEAQEITF